MKGRKKMKGFNEVWKEYEEKLVQFVPIVDRVHGGSHPEFHDVHRIFKDIFSKVREAGIDKANLEEEFKELRRVTSNYKVPENVCETYEFVYKVLEDLDNAYQG